MSQSIESNLISSAQLTYAQKVRKGRKGNQRNTPAQSKQAQQQQQQQQQQSQQPRSQPPSQQSSQRKSQQRSATQPQRASSRQAGNQRGSSQQRQDVQAQHAQQQQVRMLPVNQHISHLFAAPTTQQYTYPCNYTDLQQQISRGSYGAQPYYPRDAPQLQARAPPRFRDTNTRYNNRRRRQYSGNRRNFQRSPYQSSTRPGYGRNRGDGRSSSACYKRRGNLKLTESQFGTYEAAAVLCWIYENQGWCRYGENCQWLHLDRETGQYVPTVYILNSLESTQYRGKASSSTGERKEEPLNDGDDDKQQEDNEEESAGGRGDGDKAEKDSSWKFQILMTKLIQQKIDDKEKVDQNEEDNKQAADKEDQKDEKYDLRKAKYGKADNKEAGDEDEEDDDDREDGGDKDKDKKKDGQKYGTYGTTFDKQNVCWEFNTFVGCRKGTKCKWAHQYLIATNVVHPYTGEKLNGLAVEKFRIANNL